MNLIYILGVGHSGTTLLDIILGSGPKSESLGELIWLGDWLNKFDDKVCSCGKVLSSCSLWGFALRSWMDQIQQNGVNQYSQLQKQFEFTSSATLYMVRREAYINLPDYSHYCKLTHKLLKYIGAVNGASILVDSSKSPIRAHAFLHNPDLDLYFIHITRDPRAVAGSLLKRSPNRVTDLLTCIRSAIGWIMHNMQCRAILHEAGSNHSIHIRYEDLINTPYPTISSIVNMVGVELSPILEIISEGHPFIRKHPIDGNPMRLNPTIHIKSEGSYKEKIPAVFQYLVWMISGTYAKTYGYKFND